jgi:MFS family permease
MPCRDHHASRDVSENSPLLQDDTNLAHHSQEQPKVSRKRKQRIIVLLCAFAFTMMLGDNIQPAALIQVFENVVCSEYYEKRPSALYSSSSTLQTDPCKAQAVQTELALVRGVQQLVPLFAALLCTLPYGPLTERIGRKRVLIMSGVGVFASLS